MMNNIKILFFALFLLALLPACNQGEKVGVVDMRTVFTESDTGKAGVKELQELGNTLQEKIAALQEEAKEGESEEQKANVTETFQKFQMQMQAKEQEIVLQIQQRFDAVIKEFREKNNYSVILKKEDALAFSEAADITQAVIKAMNEYQEKADPAPESNESAKTE